MTTSSIKADLHLVSAYAHRVSRHRPIRQLAQSDGTWIALWEFMHATHATALVVPTAPVAIEAHYETENRTVWNDETRMNEEREFVYEVSWIAELGLWRRFLRAQRKA